MAKRNHTYESNDLSVTYELKRCIHAAECVRGLPRVFNPKRKPWVELDHAEADDITTVVLRCPSGALHISESGGEPYSEPVPERNSVVICADGPLYLRGDIVVKTREDEIIARDTRMALCRCGASKNKPFCDNSHKEVGFRDEGALGTSGIMDPGGAEEGGPWEVIASVNGPLRLKGPYEIHSADGKATSNGIKSALCRCGGSSNKPYCDGTHRSNGFMG
jgi:CDGSH-type Zn-finger protein/uncharacterized Fe-S cluster protein YjdI